MTIPTFEVIDLTPELAARFLAEQSPNRRQKEMKIQQFARDMTAGRWLFTAEPVKFGIDGRMVDGQNRCAAVVRSGATIQVVKANGLSPDAQAVMDSGTPRSMRDALTFAGHSSTKDLAATISTHRAWTMGAFPHCMANLGSSRATNSEALAYLDAHPSLEWGAEAGRHIYNHGLRLPVGSVATALVETSRIDAAASADFFSRIRELKTEGQGDPVATLIKRVAAIRDAAHRPLPSTSLFMLFRAWNAFRAGEKLLKFQFGAPARDNSPSTWVRIPDPR